MNDKKPYTLVEFNEISEELKFGIAYQLLHGIKPCEEKQIEPIRSKITRTVKRVINSKENSNNKPLFDLALIASAFMISLGCTTGNSVLATVGLVFSITLSIPIILYSYCMFVDIKGVIKSHIAEKGERLHRIHAANKMLESNQLKESDMFSVIEAELEDYLDDQEKKLSKINTNLMKKAAEIKELIKSRKEAVREGYDPLDPKRTLQDIQKTISKNKEAIKLLDKQRLEIKKIREEIIEKEASEIKKAALELSSKKIIEIQDEYFEELFEIEELRDSVTNNPNKFKEVVETTVK